MFPDKSVSAIQIASPACFALFSIEDLGDERVYGLCDAHYSCEYDAPCADAVESAGGADDDDVEQDVCCERDESDVSAGDAFLEHLYECGHDQCHETGCECCCGGKTHSFLLGLIVNVVADIVSETTMVVVSSGVVDRVNEIGVGESVQL